MMNNSELRQIRTALQQCEQLLGATAAIADNAGNPQFANKLLAEANAVKLLRQSMDLDSGAKEITE